MWGCRQRLRVSSTEEAQEGEGKQGRVGTFLLWTKGVESVLPGSASRWQRAQHTDSKLSSSQEKKACLQTQDLLEVLSGVSIFWHLWVPLGEEELSWATH